MTFDRDEFVGMLMEQMEDRESPPWRPFRCPHCGLMQIRIWPYPCNNPCNGCQEYMDTGKADQG